MPYNFTFNTKSFGIISVIAVGLYSIPLTLPQFVKKLYEKSDVETPPELVTHVKKIAHLMGIVPNKSDAIKVFITRDMQSVSFGAPFLPFGAYIGVPRYFLWTGVEDAKDSAIYKKGVLVDWNTDFGNRLASCLTPSGSQINFRIAHELAHLKSKHHLFITTAPPMLLFILWVLTTFVTPLISSKMGFTISTTNLGALVIWGILFLAEMSRVRHRYEFEADKMAAEVGLGFAEGGIELFFRQRQIAALLGDDSDFSESTHPSTLSRQKELQKIMIERYQYNFD